MLTMKLFNIKNIKIFSVLEIAVIYLLLKLSGEDSIKFTLSEIILSISSRVMISELYTLVTLNPPFTSDKTK